MIGVDYFASTVRGLFLQEGLLERGATELPLSPLPVPAGAPIVVEVVSAPKDAKVRNLEIIEPVQGSLEAWQTKEIALSEGDIFVGATGSRFANHSVNGHAPKQPVPAGETINLLNTGGVIGNSASQDLPMVKLKVLGGIKQGNSLALMSDLASISGASSPEEDDLPPSTPLVLITGSDMDVGKTTCAAALALSLRSSGIRVTFAKLTGTGRMRDLMRVYYGRPHGYYDTDRLAWDFVDSGLASTFEIDRDEVRRRARFLLRHAAAKGEVVLAEVADAPNDEGSIHVTTDPWLKTWLKRCGLVICACDSVSSTLTAQWIRSHIELGEEEILISGPVADNRATRDEVEREIGLSTVSYKEKSRLSTYGGDIPGGAMADWVIRHIMTLRRAIE
ncbi:MAG: hypothetical protein HOC91_03200 [Nitrospinaceae bacterium]|nr:hypothetical protein [Nitrospinaceae bacterium]MBT4095674.1 hypothetical protein [Nitrospinaceae bacterium]MBT4429502.1 hypothetical protein [Nitrospinaceae bacterium]MBT5947029.1 hypothetical protein [Nitrospinaceae bacterium]MBT6396621.1 hypothetical protein [Nitrospinaceae bacterium]